MKAVNVSLCQKTDISTISNYRVWLILTGFTKTEQGKISIIKQNDNTKYIQAILKITRDNTGYRRGEVIKYLIPIAGECAPYGRRIIRDIMEASGFAKVGEFDSYSINNYNELINLHFPAYINGDRLDHIINPYTELTKLEVR